MPFFPVETLKFTPESYLPNSVYVPHYFKPELVTIGGDKLALEMGSDGVVSTIHLMDNLGTELHPFIDLSMYDIDSKSWLWSDDDGLFYRYRSNALENLYPSNYSGVTGNGDTLNFDTATNRLYADFEALKPSVSRERAYYSFYKYAPFILTVNKEPFTDVSDYAYMRISDRLNRLDSTIKEFYYDFRGRLFTNQNLGVFDPKTIQLSYYKSSSNQVTVKCRMANNTGATSTFTPVVYDYVLKLKGQNLRG